MDEKFRKYVAKVTEKWDFTEIHKIFKIKLLLLLWSSDRPRENNESILF